MRNPSACQNCFRTVSEAQATLQYSFRKVQNCFRTVSETHTPLHYRFRQVQNCFRTASETHTHTITIPFQKGSELFQNCFRNTTNIQSCSSHGQAIVKHSMPMPSAYQDNTGQQQLPKPLVETYLRMVASSNNQGMANNSASMRRPQRCQSDFAEQPWQFKV